MNKIISNGVAEELYLKPYPEPSISVLSFLLRITKISPSMETLEFVIYPDGRVQELVTGIIGASCAEVTAAIEAQLGQVMTQEQTSEYFAQQNYQSTTVTAQTPLSQW